VYIKYHVAGVVRVGVAHGVAVYVPGVTAQASSNCLWQKYKSRRNLLLCHLPDSTSTTGKLPSDIEKFAYFLPIKMENPS
jgi:hypothetical protein